MDGYPGSSARASASEVDAGGDSGCFATADLAFLPGAVRPTRVVAGLRAGSLTGDWVRASLDARVARFALVVAAWGASTSFVTDVAAFTGALRVTRVVVFVGLGSGSFLVARVARVARATGFGASGFVAGLVTSVAFWVRFVARAAGFLGSAGTGSSVVLVFFAAGVTAVAGASGSAARARLPVTRFGGEVGLVSAAAFPAAGLRWERVATMMIAVGCVSAVACVCFGGSCVLRLVDASAESVV